VVREVKGENKTEVTLPGGKIVHLPRLEECMKWDYNVPHVPSTFADRNSTSVGGSRRVGIRDGWLDNAFYWTDREGDSHEYVYEFKGYYTLPNTPKTSGGLLYYFLGTQNNDGSSNLGVTILQPVLTYFGRWYMNSWNCCPNGQSHESGEIDGFGPGDKVYGDMYETGAELTGKWDIVSTYGSSTATLVVADSQRTFDWIDATLETYYVGNDCSKLASGPMVYSEMELTTQNEDGKHIERSIQWGGANDSGCSGTTDINSPTRITIEHNV
jgi:hypothetical protein